MVIMSLHERLEQALESRHPVIYLCTAEEKRVVDALEKVSGGTAVVSWTCTQGLEPGPGTELCDPVAALRTVGAGGPAAYYLFKDLTDHFADPRVVRAVRDAYYRLQDAESRLILISPLLDVPDTIKANVHVVEVDLPDGDELGTVVREVLGARTGKLLPDELIHELALSLRGMTLDHARYVLHRVLRSTKLSRQRLLDEVRVAKKSFAAGAGYIEYVPVDREASHIGGLSNFKAWLNDRATIFNARAVESGLPVPRGILIMGVSGCGKSLCAKVVAGTWNVPLYRLDMNLVYSELYGNAEATFHKALRAIESLAPAVLWIDEIENGLGFGGETTAIQSHIFSAFLTWMQEKPPLVFVAATANRIEFLPAEMIRKGRFDQVFFVDLPDPGERSELFDIHLRASGVDPADYDVGKLVAETDGYNGAEIEQTVNAARIIGTRDKRQFTTQDVVDQSRQIVPLSRTMSEQIKLLRDWAWNRATPASRGKGTEFSILDSASARS